MADHPYYPPDVVLPGFVSNDISVPVLLTTFASASTLVIWVTSILARTIRPGISKADLFTTIWFMLCGCIHLFFEGYFSYNNGSMPARTDLFGQLWKEYAKADSRYLTRDSFTVCMESVTAFAWGPLSFLIGWLVIKNNPLRHPLQIIVSLGQLYGTVLYFVIFFFDDSVYGTVYGRSEPLYFWVYFVTLNAFWFFIPLIQIAWSSAECVRALRFAQDPMKKKASK